MERKDLVFLLVSAAIFIDMMMYSIIIPIIPAYSTGLGADEMTVGIIFGAFSIALLCFSIPFGVLSDQIGRTPLLVAGMLLLAAANAVFAVSGDVYVLVLARIVQGTSGAATWSAGLALIADTFGPSERGVRLGTAMAIMSVGTLLGPVVGGIVYDSLGYSATFALPAAMALAVGVAFLLVRPSPGAPASRGSYARLLKKAPLALVVCSVAIVVSAITFGIIEPFMPLYLFERFSASPTLIGLTFGAMSLLNIAAAPVVGKLYDTFGGRALMAPGLALCGLLLVGVTAMPSLALTAAAFAALGIALSLGLTPMLPLLTDLFGGEKDSSGGLIYGIYNTLFSLGLAIGPLLGGALVVTIGLPATMLGQSALLLLAGFLVLAAVRDGKKEA
jgi:MFS family permease